MTEHAYPTQAMLGDYVRAAAGLLPAIMIVALLPVGLVGATMAGGFAALFAAFAIRTALRHGSCLKLTEGAIRSSGLVRTSISLCELDHLKLAYYSTRRDGRAGWMQLDLRSGASTLRLDSRLEGFTRVVKASAQAAEARGLALGAATQANLRALGIELGSPDARFGAVAAGEVR